MRAIISTRWSISPQSWADANDRDPDRCAHDLIEYFSYCWYEHAFLWREEGDLETDGWAKLRSAQELPDEGDGRVRVSAVWEVSADQEVWERMYDLPPHTGRQHLVRGFLREALVLGHIGQTDAVMEVVHAADGRPGEVTHSVFTRENCLTLSQMDRLLPMPG